MSQLVEHLQSAPSLFVHQRHELAELVGYETRNKYEILTNNGQQIGFAAEQQKGLGYFLLRQFLGHWRTFEIFIFDQNRNLVFKCHHPFRFIFNRFDIYDANGVLVGSLQQRFALLSRRFDVLGARGEKLMEMISPLLRIWTFKFLQRTREVARIEKKWSGVLSEAFTDKDRFLLSFKDRNMLPDVKALLLASCLFVDLMYFEKKANN